MPPHFVFVSCHENSNVKKAVQNQSFAVLQQPRNEAQKENFKGIATVACIGISCI